MANVLFCKSRLSKMKATCRLKTFIKANLKDILKTLERNSSGQHHFYHEPHLLPHQTHFHIIAGLQNYFSAPAQLRLQHKYVRLEPALC